MLYPSLWKILLCPSDTTAGKSLFAKQTSESTEIWFSAPHVVLWALQQWYLSKEPRESLQYHWIAQKSNRPNKYKIQQRWVLWNNIIRSFKFLTSLTKMLTPVKSTHDTKILATLRSSWFEEAKLNHGNRLHKGKPKQLPDVKIVYVQTWYLNLDIRVMTYKPLGFILRDYMALIL